jgi:type IV secretion system protein VirB6
MNFFTQYFAGLQALLLNYVSNQVGVVAAAITPIFVAFGTMYVMFWGWLHLTGKIEEPVLEGAKRIVTVGVLFSIGLQMWTLHSVLVLAFLQGPQALATAILGGGPPLAVIDNIWNQGNQVAQLFWADAGVMNGNFGFFFAAIATWLIVGMLVIYTAFLFSLATVALAVLLAAGPIFIAFLFFDSTKRFFESWIAQLANYAIIVLLASLIAALILNSVNNAANTAIGFGSTLTILEAMNFFVTTILAFLLMRQVMSIASGLASGVALATGGIVSGLMRRGMGTAGRFNRGVWDAMTNQGTSRWDAMSRKGGYQTARTTGRAVKAMWRTIRPNEIKPS